jgi:hypothetical protein
LSCNTTPLTCGSTKVLFGSYAAGCDRVVLDGCFSPTFIVGSCPIIIRAFDMAACEKIYLEMLGGPDNTLVARANNDCGCPMVLTSKKNRLIVATSGVYRLNRCVCDAEPLSDSFVEYETLQTPVPNGGHACSKGGK